MEMEKDWTVVSRVFLLKRLTKKVLMSLEEGCLLEQDAEIFYLGKDGKFHPRQKFGEYVAPMPEREEQWKRAVKLSANNRLCRVYLKKPSAQG